MKSHLPPTRVQLHSTQANTVATLQALCAETGWGLTVVGMPYVGPTGDAQTVCVVDGVALLRARVGAPGQGCVLICEPADLRPWVGVPGPVTEYQFAPIRRSSLKEQVTRLRVGASHTLQQCKLNGDLFLDPVDRRVLRGDQALDLTWREYEVLGLLMDSPHRATVLQLLVV